MEQTLNEKHGAVLNNLSIPHFNAMQLEVITRSAVAPHLMLLAPTGTGKTLAFLIPVLEHLERSRPGVQALIVAPSRELALQIEDVFRSMKTSFKATCFYGGHDIRIEENSMQDIPALIIGTPGRLADHIRRQTFDASTVRMVVLDEFDKSLQMGFHDQLKIVFEALSGRQNHVLTSATAMDALPDFLPFRDVVTLDHLRKEEGGRLSTKVVQAKNIEKAEVLMRLVAGFSPAPCLVFCNHRDAVERISALFHSHGFPHGIFHGAMEQIDREKNLIKFRSGAHEVLIATDLAARGLDIPEIRHVVHYQLPLTEEAFIHRNGRTARMMATGEAYLILGEDETLPAYIDPATPVKAIHAAFALPAPPPYVCIYVSAGKKDKINKGDIAGLFIKKGGIDGNDLGLITTLDHASFVAVKRESAGKVLSALKDERIKKTKLKIAVAS